MNRFIDYESLKVQNYQLKNEITDLKNGFDLNRTILSMLQEQSKQAQPKLQRFYQIIQRLTIINNQIMFNNIKFRQQKNKLLNENKKLLWNLQNLSQKLQNLLQCKDNLTPKQIHIQMREQIKQLRVQVLALNEECLRKNIQISKLQALIKNRQRQDLKKPIIPSLKSQQTKITRQQIQQIPKRHQTNQVLKSIIVNKSLQRENQQLKRLVYQLEYRLTILAKLHKNQQVFIKKYKEKQSYATDEKDVQLKKNQFQLTLLMFALENTVMEGDEQKEGVKITINKKRKVIKQKKYKKSQSAIF